MTRERALEVARVWLERIGPTLMTYKECAPSLADLLLRWGAAAREEGAREMRESAEQGVIDARPCKDFHSFMPSQCETCYWHNTTAAAIRALPLTPAPQGEQPDPREGDVWMVPCEVGSIDADGVCAPIARVVLRDDDSIPERARVWVSWLRANGRLLRRKGGA